MVNIAYTSEYKEQRKEWEAVFTPQNRIKTESMHPETAESDFRKAQLTRWFSGMKHCHIERSYYKDVHDDKERWGVETTISDRTGLIVYQYRTDDDNCDFFTLLQHSNGCEYFLFRTGLYGYGVYDITAKREFIFIPDAQESFIWTDVHYDPETNMLAVEGCFWACPWGIILLNFADPMAEVEWIDVISVLDDAYDKYDELEFGRWENGNLILKADELVEVNGETTTKPTQLIISETQYRAWFS